jgi:hypothetical protein
MSRRKHENRSWHAQAKASAAGALEGGGIDVNGPGTLLTSEERCLDQKPQCRNPGMPRQEYGQIFRDYLGATNVKGPSGGRHPRRGSGARLRHPALPDPATSSGAQSLSLGSTP